MAAQTTLCPMPKSKPTLRANRSRGPANSAPNSSATESTSLARRLDLLMQRIPKGAFSAAGGALGGPVGAMAGKTISNITGYGDYAVKHNSVSTVGAHGGVEVPSFSNRSVRITHREYFADVRVPADGTVYNNQVYDLSPTNPAFAPWLSTIAQKFAKYRIHGLVFYYKPMSTDYNNSGTVALAVNYDPIEGPYVSMQGMLNSKFAVSTKPSVAMVAPVECDPSTMIGGGILTVDHPGVNAYSSDKRFTSLGSLNVATSGLTMDAGSVLGQLHMTIDLELINPFLHQGLAPNVGFYQGFAAAGETSYTTFQGRTPSGVSVVKDRFYLWVYLPVGEYMIERRYGSDDAGTAVQFEPYSAIDGNPEPSRATVVSRDYIFDTSTDAQEYIGYGTVQAHVPTWVRVVSSSSTAANEFIDRVVIAIVTSA